MTGPIKPGRLDALDRLMAAIHDHTQGGESVPCVDAERGHLWLSDNDEHQAAALHGCAICPALVACRSYVRDFPESAGVWAGLLPPSQKTNREDRR